MSSEYGIYSGEDAELIVDFIDVNFADLQDVIVGVVIGKALKKTWKKSTVTDANQVVAVSGKPTQCKVRLYRSETATWPEGPMSVEVTQVFTDAGFPSGKHVPFKQYLVQFENLLTKTA